MLRNFLIFLWESTLLKVASNYNGHLNHFRKSVRKNLTRGRKQNETNTTIADDLVTLHCKKKAIVFLFPAGMSLTKLSLAGNYYIIPSQREISRLETVKNITFLTVYKHTPSPRRPAGQGPQTGVSEFG
jgi:hypothetical protein